MIGKIIKWLFILGLIGAGGWWWWNRPGEEGIDLSDYQPEIISIERGDMRVVVEATGAVTPNSTVEVKSKASGEILRMPYEAGDIVTAGSLLAELDPDDERRNVERAESDLASAQARLLQSRGQLLLIESDTVRTMAQAQASLNQAQARFEDARGRFERRQDLHNDGVLSDEEFESTRVAFEEAHAGLISSQAAFDDAQSFEENVTLRQQDVLLAEVSLRDAKIQLEEARERFEDTRIVSPVSGVITDLQVEEGQIIASGISNVGGGTTLMVISDLSRLFIEVQVDETDIGRVEIGQRCEVIADAYPQRIFDGAVEWISPQGTDENNIVSFDVRVEIDLESGQPQRQWGGEGSPEVTAEVEPPPDLRPNMTARVEIITADLEDVVLVPNEAIQGRGDQRTVLLHNPEGEGETIELIELQEGEEDPALLALAEQYTIVMPPTEERRIRLGVSDGLQTHISEGLEGDEEIVIPVPEWRIEFLRAQLMPEEESDDRRRRMFF